MRRLNQAPEGLGAVDHQPIGVDRELGLDVDVEPLVQVAAAFGSGLETGTALVRVRKPDE